MAENSVAPGDHVVHPAHGLGTVVKIEDRSFRGEVMSYVTIDVEDMRLLVPEHELEDIGVRDPADADDADEVLELLGGDSLDDPGHRGRRRRNDKRIRSGEIEELAKVVRSLKALEAESEKGLKHHDLMHLREATDRLVAELSIALGISEEDARAKVRKAVGDPIGDPEDTVAA